jgi:hypothetical protein
MCYASARSAHTPAPARQCLQDCWSCMWDLADTTGTLAFCRTSFQVFTPRYWRIGCVFLRPSRLSPHTTALTTRCVMYCCGSHAGQHETLWSLQILTDGTQHVCRERAAGILVPQATVDPLQNNATLATFSMACRGVEYARAIRSLFISPGALARICMKNLEEAHHRVLYCMNKKHSRPIER